MAITKERATTSKKQIREMKSQIKSTNQIKFLKNWSTIINNRNKSASAAKRLQHENVPTNTTDHLKVAKTVVNACIKP